MDETVDRGGGRHWVLEDSVPLRKDQVGGDHDASPLVSLGQEGEIEELYDLDNDPEELNNLALGEEHATRLRRMRVNTIAELKRTKAARADILQFCGDRAALGNARP